MTALFSPVADINNFLKRLYKIPELLVTFELLDLLRTKRELFLTSSPSLALT